MPISTFHIVNAPIAGKVVSATSGHPMPVWGIVLITVILLAMCGGFLLTIIAQDAEHRRRLDDIRNGH